MAPVRRSIPLLLASALVVAACSGSDAARGTTLATETTETTEAGTPAAPATTSGRAEESSSSPTTTPTTAPPAPAPSSTSAPTTTEPAVQIAPVIEDVLVDLADVRVYSTYQRGLLPPYDDPQPGGAPAEYDRTTTPCVYNWTRNWADAEGGDYRRLEVRACEFPDMAAADAYEAVFIEGTTDLASFSDEFVASEPYEVGAWAGRFGATAERDGGEVFRHWNVGRRHGLRFFEVTAQDQLVASEAEQLLVDLIATQDELIDALGVGPETPGPGFADYAARASLDDMLLPWAEMVELGGEDPADWSSSFEQQLTLLDRTRVADTGRRQVEFPSGTIWLRAEQFVTETDAAGALVDVGEAEPIQGNANAFRSAIESDGTDSAWFIAGDRRYGVDVSKSLAADTERPLVERVVAALVEHLAGLGLAAEPEATPHPVPVDPVLDIVPLGAFADLPAGWQLSRVDVSVDPTTGTPLVDVSVEQVVGASFAARRVEADYVLGVDRGQFIDRFAPDVGTLEPGEWKQRVDEDASIDGATGENQTYYSTYFVGHDNGVGLSVWPDNTASLDRADAERPLEDRYADDMASMLVIGQRIEAAAADADVDSIRLAGRALWLVDQRHLRTSTADIELFDDFGIPNGFVVLGEPGAGSPSGAVADWWRPTDHLTGADPSAAPSSVRATLFASASDAERHLATVVGAGAGAEQVAGNEVGGVVSDDGGGVFATVRGPWYFELVNRGFGRDPGDRFGAEVSTVAPADVLRAAAVEWTSAIEESGLG